MHEVLVPVAKLEPGGAASPAATQAVARRRARNGNVEAAAGHAERLLPDAEIGARRRRRGFARARSRPRAQRLPARPSRAAGARRALRVDPRVAAPAGGRSPRRPLRALLGRSVAARRRRIAGAVRALSALLPPGDARGRHRRSGLAERRRRHRLATLAAHARVARVVDERPGGARAAVDAPAGPVRRGGAGVDRPAGTGARRAVRGGRDRLDRAGRAGLAARNDHRRARWATLLVLLAAALACFVAVVVALRAESELPRMHFGAGAWSSPCWASGWSSATRASPTACGCSAIFWWPRR